MSRYARRVDKSQPKIVEALRAAGCTVLSLAPLGKGAPDLAVGYRGFTYLMECKSPEYCKAHPERIEEQRAWARKWGGGPVILVSTADEALYAMGLMKGKPKPTGVERFGPQHEGGA